MRTQPRGFPPRSEIINQPAKDPAEELDREVYGDPQKPWPMPAPRQNSEVLPRLESIELSLFGSDGNAAFNFLEQIQAEWRQSRQRGKRQSLVLDYVYQRIALYATAELRRQMKDVAHLERLDDIEHAGKERRDQNTEAQKAAIDAFEKLMAVAQHVTVSMEELRKSNAAAAKLIEVHVNHLFTSLQALAVIPTE